MLGLGLSCPVRSVLLQNYENLIVNAIPLHALTGSHIAAHLLSHAPLEMALLPRVLCNMPARKSAVNTAQSDKDTALASHAKKQMHQGLPAIREAKLPDFLF